MHLSDREKYRNAITKIRTVTIATTGTLLLSGDPNRIAITFIAGPTNRYSLNMNGIATLDSGLTIHPGTVPFTLSLCEHGGAVIAEWRGISATADQAVTVIETVMIH